MEHLNSIKSEEWDLPPFNIVCSSLLFSQTKRLWNYKFNSLIVLLFKKEIIPIGIIFKNIRETVLYRHYLNLDLSLFFVILLMFDFISLWLNTYWWFQYNMSEKK